MLKIFKNLLIAPLACLLGFVAIWKYDASERAAVWQVISDFDCALINNDEQKVSTILADEFKRLPGLDLSDNSTIVPDDKSSILSKMKKRRSEPDVIIEYKKTPIYIGVDGNKGRVIFQRDLKYRFNNKDVNVLEARVTINFEKRNNNWMIVSEKTVYRHFSDENEADSLRQNHLPTKIKNGFLWLSGTFWGG